MKLIFKIEYDGTNFSGWQIQQNANSIQESIERVIFDLTGCKTILVAAGRTDAGVHARGMIAHLNLNFELKIPLEKIPIILNSMLPKEIRIIDTKLTNSDFHARFSAIAREYCYHIHFNPSVFNRRFSTLYNFELDTELLKKTAELFLGEHNFTPFSKNNPDTKSYYCRVEISEWDLSSKSFISFRIKANRFVYGMVRSLIGAMIEVSRSKINISEIIEALQEPDRKPLYTLAPPNGLILEKIYYPEHLDFFK